MDSQAIAELVAGSVYSEVKSSSKVTVITVSEPNYPKLMISTIDNVALILNKRGDGLILDSLQNTTSTGLVKELNLSHFREYEGEVKSEWIDLILEKASLYNDEWSALEMHPLIKLANKIKMEIQIANKPTLEDYIDRMLQDEQSHYALYAGGISSRRWGGGMASCTLEAWNEVTYEPMKDEKIAPTHRSQQQHNAIMALNRGRNGRSQHSRGRR